MIVEQKELQELYYERSGGSIWGYCSGTFDLTHAGHLSFFAKCKAQCDILVVGVAGDAAVEQYKGRRPVISQHHRLAMVDGLKSVDYCFVNSNGSVDEDFENIIKALRPHKYFYGPDSGNLVQRLVVCERYDVEPIKVPRLEGRIGSGDLSTSSVIERCWALERYRRQGCGLSA